MGRAQRERVGMGCLCESISMGLVTQEWGKRQLWQVMAGGTGHMHLQSLCLVLVDRWRYPRGTLQPPRAGAARTATQRRLR